MRRVRIADNLFYGVDRAAWGGNGNFMQIGDGPSELIVEHNTIIHTNNVLTVYGGSREAPSVGERFVFRNNIARHNANGVIGQSLAIGTDTINAFFPGAVFMSNVLAGGRASRYPGDNLFPEIERFSQQFVNYAGRRLPAEERQRVPARRHRRRRSRRQLRRAGPDHRRARARVARTRDLDSVTRSSASLDSPALSLHSGSAPVPALCVPFSIRLSSRCERPRTSSRALTQNPC